MDWVRTSEGQSTLDVLEIKPQRPDSDGLDISRGRTVVQAEGLEEGQKRRVVDVAKEDMKFMASREA